MEGQTACGIFAVCSGQVTVSTSSLEGKAIVLKIAEAGELLGLPSTLSGNDAHGRIMSRPQPQLVAYASSCALDMDTSVRRECWFSRKAVRL